MDTYSCDTGPLLCFGLVEGGRALLRGWLDGRLEHCEIIRGELRHLAKHPPSRELGLAAAGWEDSWLPTPIKLNAKEAEDVANHHAGVQEYSRSWKQDVDADEDHGEAHTITVAIHRGWRVLMCERAGCGYARKMGVTVRTPVDILRGAVDVAELSTLEAWDHYQTMADHSHPGEHLLGSLELETGMAEI